MQPPLRHDPVLEFSVSFSLREYLSIVQDHFPIALAAYDSRGSKPRKRTPKLAKWVLILVASVMFYFKKRRMPICHFVINGERIKRVTQDGILEIPWIDVVAVHRYRLGYMVQKSKGAVPLPYRCLTKSQRKLLEAFIQQWSEVQK